MSKSKKNKRIPPAPRYVIIYVPTGNNTDNVNDSISAVKGSTSKGTTTNNASSSSSSSTTSGVGASVVSRFAAARQRMTSAVAVGRTSSSNTSHESTETTGDDSHTVSTTTTTTDANAITDDELLGPSNLQPPVIPSAAIQQLNRLEREIARRFVNDFPAGNVCTLSTLFDAPATSSLTSPTLIVPDEESRQNTATTTTAAVPENIVQQLEWQAVLKRRASIGNRPENVGGSGSSNSGAKAGAAPGATAPAAGQKKAKLSYKEMRDLDALPGQIAALEAEQKSLEATLANPATYARTDPAAVAEAARLKQRFDTIESEMLEALERWDALEKKRG